MEMLQQKRTYWLDGLKFISMIIVFLCHFRMAFFPDQYGVINIFSFSIPNYIFRGNLAVCMFLIISVYLMMKKSLDKIYNEEDIMKIILQRVVRLAVPTIIVNIFILIIFLLNGFQDTKWFKLGSPIKAFVLTLYSSITCLFSNTNINPPLWCLYLLFLFPVLSFLILQIFRNRKIVFYCSIIILPILLSLNYYISVLPIVLIILSQNRDVKMKKISISLSLLFIFAIIFIQSIDVNGNFKILLKFTNTFDVIMASSIFNIFYLNSDKNILNYSFFSKLNKISFSIYLLHMIVICTVGYYVYSITDNIFITFFSILIILIILCMFFEKYVENKLCKKIINKYLK